MGRRAKITSAEAIKREQRAAAIVQMRLQGFTLREIGAAQHPPVSNVAIFKAIKRTLERTISEATEQARRLEEMRCDEMLAGGLYERAIGGDAQAAGAVLAIMTRRARLLGLDVQPARAGADPHELPTVKIEIVGGEEMAHAEQVALARLGLARHLA
jgi:hypothetical protein